MKSEEFYATIENNITNSGQHLQAVFSTKPEDGPPFIYTIGNHQRGLPELLIVGNYGASFAAILNDLGRRMRERNRPFDNGELVSLGGSFPLKMVDVPSTVNETFCIQVGRYYGTEEFRVQQAVLCDPKGRFPGDEGCDRPYLSQVEYLRAGLN